MLLGLLACAPACDGDGRGSRGELAELERLAFVPPGECAVSSSIVCSNDAALLVDRYEVTRDAWRRWVASGEIDPAPSARAVYAEWGPEDGELPAGYLDLDEARSFAAARGMRLLTASEWMRVASGTSRQKWPWGYKAISVANTLELGLRRPAAVGTFEQGSTPLGTYDMLGNVWEWVEGRIAAEPGAARKGDDPAWVQAWVMGGSYLTLQRSLLEPYEAASDVPVYHAVLDRRHRALDVGLRCAADAEAYLLAHAGGWGTGARDRERLVAIGASWGPSALPLLEELAARDGAPEGLAWLAEGAAR